MFCSNCGTPLADGAKFCEKCGAPIIAAAQANQAPQPEAQPAAQIQPEPQPEAQPAAQIQPEPQPDVAAQAAPAPAPAPEPEPAAVAQPAAEPVPTEAMPTVAQEPAPAATQEIPASSPYATAQQMAAAPATTQQMPNPYASAQPAQQQTAPYAAAQPTAQQTAAPYGAPQQQAAPNAPQPAPGAPQPGHAAPPAQGGRPKWLIPVIIVAAVALVAIIIGAVSCGSNATSGGSSSAASSTASSGGSGPSIITSSAEGFAGSWDLKKGSIEGLEEDSLAMLRQAGLNNTLTLNEDGTGEFDIMGSVSKVTWEATSDTAGTTTIDGTAFDMALSGDELTLKNKSGDTLTFVPQGTLPSSGTSTSSGSSASASSGSAPSGSSGTSATSSGPSPSGKTVEFKAEGGYGITVDSTYSVHEEKSTVRVHTAKDGVLPWFSITSMSMSSGNNAEKLLNATGQQALEDHEGTFIVEPTANKVKLADGREVKGFEYAYTDPDTGNELQVLNYVDEQTNGFMYSYTAVAYLNDSTTPAAMQQAMESFHFLAS